MTLTSLPQHSQPSLASFIREHLTEDRSLPDSAMTLPDETLPLAGTLALAPGVSGVVDERVPSAEVITDLAAKVTAAVTDLTDAAAMTVYDALESVPAARTADLLLEKLDGGLLDQTNLLALTTWLAERSPSRPATKLGLALMSLLDAPPSDLLRDLGVHESFTHYAVIGLQQCEQYDHVVWEIAQRVHGWGRVYTVTALAGTEDPAIQSWLLSEGFRNNVMNARLARIAAETGHLVDRLSEDPTPLDVASAAEMISALITGGVDDDVSEYADAPTLMNLYLHHLEHAAVTLNDLHTVAAIRSVVEQSERWTQEGVWTTAVRNELEDRSGEHLDNPSLTDLVLDGLASEDPEVFRTADSLAEMLGVDTFEWHIERLHEDFSSGSWHEAWRQVTDTDRAETVAALTTEFLLGDDEEVTSRTLEFTEHMALSAALRNLEYHSGVGALLVLLGLRSPAPRTRQRAIDTIAGWNTQDRSDDHLAALRFIAEGDTDPAIKNAAASLL